MIINVTCKEEEEKEQDWIFSKVVMIRKKTRDRKLDDNYDDTETWRIMMKIMLKKAGEYGDNDYYVK